MAWHAIYLPIVRGTFRKQLTSISESLPQSSVSLIMAYFAPGSRTEEGGFEYPPVPDAYIDSLSTFDAYSGRQKHAPEPHPSFYPPYGYQAVASTPESPCHSSYPDHGQRLSPASSTTSPAFMSQTLPHADAPDLRVIPYPANVGYRKRPRGTTGGVVCEKCGGKFTVISSLNRHNKICHGKKRAKKLSSTQHKTGRRQAASILSDHCISTSPSDNSSLIPTEERSHAVESNLDLRALSAASTIADGQRAENASMALDHRNDALRVNNPSHVPPTEQSQVGELTSSLHAVLAASTLVRPPNAERARMMSDPNTLNPYSKKPMSVQSYVPQSEDTSTDHNTFFCDICPGTFAHRDRLQLHKAKIHGLTKIPYLPDSGTIDRPAYLSGVTFDTTSKHSRRALQTFEGGGLSTSPCQACSLNRQECVVNPFHSSTCSYCNYRGSGNPCGAAGVKYL